MIRAALRRWLGVPNAVAGAAHVIVAAVADLAATRASARVCPIPIKLRQDVGSTKRLRVVPKMHKRVSNRGALGCARVQPQRDVRDRTNGLRQVHADSFWGPAPDRDFPFNHMLRLSSVCGNATMAEGCAVSSCASQSAVTHGHTSVIHRHRTPHHVHDVVQDVQRRPSQRHGVQILQAIKEVVGYVVAQILPHHRVDERGNHVADRERRDLVLPSSFSILHHAHGATG